jgi:hypothetical protein
MLSVKLKTIKLIHTESEECRILKHALEQTRVEKRSWTQEQNKKRKMGKLATPEGVTN